MSRTRWTPAVLVFSTTLMLAAVAASAEPASDQHDLAGRISLRLGSGLSAHTLDKSDGPFFFADFAVGYGVFEGLSAELQYTFTFLRTKNKGAITGVASQVHGIMPGVTYRFMRGTFVPHAGVHLGYARTRDATSVGGEDISMNGNGFVMDVRGGLEIFLARSFALDVFASYNLATEVPAVTDDGREKKTANYFFVGAGILFAI